MPSVSQVMVAATTGSLPLSGRQILRLIGPDLILGLAAGMVAAAPAGTVIGIPAALALMLRLPRLAWLVSAEPGPGDDPQMPGLC